MGALHVREYDLEQVAFNGRAWAGEVVAVRQATDEIDARVDHTWDRNLPERKGLLAKLASQLVPERPPEVRVQTFTISPPPVATDAHSHPLFERLAGGLRIDEVAPGDRVIVLTNPGFTGVLRDEPKLRARVAAAFDRSGDLAWAAAASVEDLHRALLERDRWDVAFAELRWRGALDARGLLARTPTEQVGGLRTVVGRLDPAERRAFVDGAAAHLVATGDRATLVALTQSLFDFVQFKTIEPLLLLLDPTAPAEQGPLTFARIRLGMILKDEPGRAADLARVAAHVGYKPN